MRLPQPPVVRRNGGYGRCSNAGVNAIRPRAIPNFVYQALTGRPITIYGDGTFTRSFCYVSDLVEGILRLVMTEIHDPVNIGNPGEYTIRELAEKIVHFTGSKSEITYHPSLQDDPRLRKPDITRARTLLGWEPTVPLDEGIQRTIEAFKHEIEGYIAHE